VNRLAAIALDLSEHNIELGIELMKLAFELQAKKPRSDAGKRRGIRRKTRWHKAPAQARRKRKRWLRSPSGKKYTKRKTRNEKKPSTKRYRKKQKSRGVHRKYNWM